MKRYPKRAVHDKATIHAILDEVLGILAYTPLRLCVLNAAHVNNGCIRRCGRVMRAIKLCLRNSLGIAWAERQQSVDNELSSASWLLP